MQLTVHKEHYSKPGIAVHLWPRLELTCITCTIQSCPMPSTIHEYLQSRVAATREEKVNAVAVANSK